MRKRTPNGTSCTLTERARDDGTIAYRIGWRPERPGQRTSWTADDRRTALRFQRHAITIGVEEAMRLEQERAGDPADPLTVAEVWDSHLDQLTRAKTGTVDKYRKRVRGSWLDELGTYPIDGVTREHCQAWLKGRLLVRAPKTVKNEGMLLTAMFKTAVAKGLITLNPAERLGYPTIYPKQIVVLSTEEFNALIAGLRPWWRPFVHFLASTGMRINEAAAIRWGDIDLHLATARIQQGWHDTDKGRVLETPKTPRSRRTIDLDDVTVQALQLVRDRAAERGHDTSPTGFVFTAPRGGAVRDNAFREDVWHPDRVAAGVRYCTPHDMRHLHASWMLAAGLAIEDVSERLGHENTQITYSTYRHLVPSLRARYKVAIAVAMAGTHAWMPGSTIAAPSGGKAARRRVLNRARRQLRPAVEA